MNPEIVQERLYIIRWTMLTMKNEEEPKVETYEWKDRQQAIERFLKLKDQWYAMNLRMQVAQPQDIDISRMLESL
jgi:hypothetical protein